MTLKDLYKKVTEENGITQNKAEAIVKSVFRNIHEELKNNGRLSVPGFGTFSVKTRAEKKGRNPRTGEEITIPEKKVIVFKETKAQ